MAYIAEIDRFVQPERTYWRPPAVCRFFGVVAFAVVLGYLNLVVVSYAFQATFAGKSYHVAGPVVPSR